MPVSESWYSEVDNATLRQGDIFRAVPAIQFPQDLVIDGVNINTPAEVLTEDWIVLDASCDVEHREGRPAVCQQVLLAAVREASREALRVKPDAEKEYKTRLEVLRRGLMAGKFMLPPHEGVQPPLPLSFVQYNARVLLPHAYLVARCNGPRIRLRSPHRENFGAWVASCIGRVGVEDDAQIPSFTPALHGGQALAAQAGQG